MCLRLVNQVIQSRAVPLNVIISTPESYLRVVATNELSRGGRFDYLSVQCESGSQICNSCRFDYTQTAGSESLFELALALVRKPFKHLKTP